VSFALSFSCVAAIFAFAKPIAEALETIGAPHLVREALAVAIATQLGTWPLTASAFLVVAPYAPFANALVVPIVGVAMLGGFVTLALAPIPLLAGVVANVETSFVDWIVAVVRFVASMPFAHVVATPPPPWTIVAYDGALIVAAIALRHGRTRRAIAIVACASALCLWPPRPPNHDLRIVAIDVGQADALLIRTPTGHAYLVDAGGRLERGPQLAGASSSEEIGERIVVPFLIRNGIHHLDAVLLSHPHGDHAGGLAPVLRTLGASGFADSGQSYPGHAYHDALDVARERRVPMWEPRGGDVWRTGDGVTFRFYGPTSPYITRSRSDINSNSLVFRLEYGHFRMLFTGDAGAETEQRLLTHFHDDLRCDVLKVGHHGSAYGTTQAFLDAVAPHVAIISVGRDNLFGHPAPSTIDALRRRGIAIYRTDRDGAVIVTSDGNRYSSAAFVRTSR
jgi:competence protein ComEC